MLSKRLIGTVTIKDGWAVQSFGYRKYLPLGKAECVVENLCRWGADEILVQVIDRHLNGNQPDLALLQRLANIGLGTPLIYGGGIRTVADGIRVIQTGADRIVLDAVLHDDLSVVSQLAQQLGNQALIASLPLSFSDGKLHWLDYRSGISKTVDSDVTTLLADSGCSEIMATDWKNEGFPESFDMNLVNKSESLPLPLIAFGGVSSIEQLRVLFKKPQVSAVAIGNFLNYREHSIQRFKEDLNELPIRRPTYDSRPLE